MENAQTNSILPIRVLTSDKLHGVDKKHVVVAVIVVVVVRRDNNVLRSVQAVSFTHCTRAAEARSRTRIKGYWGHCSEQRMKPAVKIANV